MKKILSIFVALVLVFALCAMPASAETKASDWKKGTGPAKINYSDEGTTITIDEGVNLYYYQPKINLKDFTVKVRFNAPTYDVQWGYFALTIGGPGKFSGIQESQNFIVMWVRGDNALCINPQILHNGQAGITPESSMLYTDLKDKDITIHATMVDEYTYQLDFNDGEMVYKYCIPENLNFIEDVNGEGCIAFGGCINQGASEGHPEGSFNVVVKEINGVKMNGQPVVEDTSSSDEGTTGGTDSDVDPDTGIFTGTIGGETTDETTDADTNTEEGGISILMIAIICGAVLLLAGAAIAIVALCLKVKKLTLALSDAEETEETSEETIEE